MLRLLIASTVLLSIGIASAQSPAGPPFIDLDIDDIIPDGVPDNVPNNLPGIVDVDPFSSTSEAADLFRSLGVEYPDSASLLDNLPQARTELPRLLVFVSYSMPQQVLMDWHKQVTKAGGVLVMRGMVNESMTETFAKATEVFGARTYAIDPSMFRMFAVDVVPRVVVLAEPIAACHEPGCALVPPKHDAMGGNVTLQFALEQFAESGASAAQAQTHLSNLVSGLE